MKPGDLVRVNPSMRDPRRRGDAVGVVIEYHPEEAYLHESVLVHWGDGKQEVEFPHWLEVVNAAG